jgi:hypothetical protein
MSVEVDFTFAVTSLEALISAFCALVALTWMVSVVFPVTAASERSISVEIALILLAASPAVDANELCASRALLRMAAAVSAPAADSVRSTSEARS